jgi:hypothetical protein
VSSKTFLSLAVILLLTGGVTIFFADRPLATAAAAATSTPNYEKNGSLLPPTGYREWVYLTSGIDMSYTAKSGTTKDESMKDESRFDNVFVNPASYRSFQQTGTWPDKTMMVLEVRGAKSRGSINLSGHYQGTDIMGMEVHVKDEARFPGKWAFFEFATPATTGTLIPQGATCYTCHAAHAAVDTTFVQFYPTLLPIAQKKGTLSEAYVKENGDVGAAK